MNSSPLPQESANRTLLAETQEGLRWRAIVGGMCILMAFATLVPGVAYLGLALRRNYGVLEYLLRGLPLVFVGLSLLIAGFRVLRGSPLPQRGFQVALAAHVVSVVGSFLLLAEYTYDVDINDFPLSASLGLLAALPVVVLLFLMGNERTGALLGSRPACFSGEIGAGAQPVYKSVAPASMMKVPFALWARWTTLITGINLPFVSFGAIAVGIYSAKRINSTDDILAVIVAFLIPVLGFANLASAIAMFKGKRWAMRLGAAAGGLGAALSLLVLFMALSNSPPKIEMDSALALGYLVSALAVPCWIQFVAGVRYRMRPPPD